MLNKFKNNPIFIKYFNNTAWLFFERILRMIVSLIVGVWIARYLGPEEFGILSYAQSFVAMFSVVASFGINNILIRELTKGSLNKNKLLGTSLFLKLIGSILLFAIVILSLQFTNDMEITKFFILIITFSFLFQGFNVIDLYYQSIVKSKYIVQINSFGLLFSSVIKIVFILKEMELVYFVILVVFDALILAIGYIYIYILQNHPFKIKEYKFNYMLAKIILKNSFPLLLSGLVVGIYMRIDQVMINYMLDSKAVGYYSSALRLSEVWYFIPTVVTASLFPAIISSVKNDRQKYYLKLQSLLTILSILSFFIIIPIFLFSKEIIDILYGDQYQAASSVLMIHIWTLLFVSLSITSGKFLTAKKMENKVFFRNFLGLIINIFLNYLLIPIYGINGAALTTLISWIVASYVYDIFDKELRYMFIYKTKAILLLNVKQIKGIF